MNVVFGIAFTVWSLFMLRGGNLYMQSIADASSGVFTLQYYLPIMTALAVAIGATLHAGWNQIFYAASKDVVYFERFLKSLLVSFVSHAAVSFFMIAIGGEDSTVYGYALMIIGLVLLGSAFNYAAALRKEYKEEANKSLKIINHPLE